MLELLWDVFLDGLLDALKALPFLFGAYLLMEFLEHRAGDKLTDTLSRLWGPGGRWGALCWAACPSAGSRWRRPIFTPAGSSPRGR